MLRRSILLLLVALPLVSAVAGPAPDTIAKTYRYKCPKGDRYSFKTGGNHNCPKHKIPMQLVDVDD